MIVFSTIGFFIVAFILSSIFFSGLDVLFCHCSGDEEINVKVSLLAALCFTFIWLTV